MPQLFIYFTFNMLLLYFVYSVISSLLCTQPSISDAAGIIPAFGFGMGMGFGGVGKHHDPINDRRAIYIHRQPQDIVEETPEGNEEIVEEIPGDGEEIIETNPLVGEESEETVEETPLGEDDVGEVSEDIPEDVEDEIPLEEPVDDEEIPVEEQPIVVEDIPDEGDQQLAGLVQSPVNCELGGINGLGPNRGISEIIIFKHPDTKQAELKDTPTTEIKSHDKSLKSKNK